MHTKSASEYRYLCCFAPSISAPGGVDASHHKVQHDRPPLPGSYRDTYSLYLTYAVAVSRWILQRTAFSG